MFCTQCGQQIPERARFCTQCGAPQIDTPAQAPAYDPAPASYAPAQAPAYDPTPVPDTPAQAPAYDPTPVPDAPAQAPACDPTPTPDAPTQAPACDPTPAQNAPVLHRLYIDAKGLTMFNYKFDIRDGAGNLRYRAGTVTEGMFTYNARVYYPDGSEAMAIKQQKKLTAMTMNFDIRTPDGNLVTEARQRPHATLYKFELPAFGIEMECNFLMLGFTFKQNGRLIASVEKKVLAWGDCYELTYLDPAGETVFLSGIMVVQMVIAATRQRRRRR